MKGNRRLSGKHFRKTLSVLLTFCLLAGMIPDAAFAQDETNAVSVETAAEAAATSESGSEAAAASEESGAAQTTAAEEAQAETETETSKTETEASKAETEATAETTQPEAAQTETEAETEASKTETEAETDAEIDASATEAESETGAAETETGTSAEGAAAASASESETGTAEGAAEEASAEEANALLTSAATLCDHGNDAETCAICAVEALIDTLPTVDEIAEMDTDGQNEIYTDASEICDAYYALSEEDQEMVSNIDALWDVLDYFSGTVSMADEEGETVSVDYIDENGSTQTCSSYTSITASDTEWSDGWYVADSTVTNSNRITVSGTVYLILVDDCTLTASSGITVNSGDTLVIYGQSGGTGVLNASASTDYYAGIGGGGQNQSSGVITINGGSITAAGGTSAAGIGGGYYGAGQNITINGGNVTATGGENGAGIGGGYHGAGQYITINSGTIVANGGTRGAGIGGGISGAGSYIEINGGDVTATGGSFATGIGGGDTAAGSYITINGGTVTAKGPNGGAGIGGGDGSSNGTGSNITITGGSVTASSNRGAAIGGGIAKAGTDITISGGYILASSNSGSAIGGGEGGSSSNITITGGYFGTGDTSAETVYSVSVATGYDVIDNTESTQTTWPYVVIEENGTYSVTLETNGGTIAEGSELTSYTYGTSVSLPDSETITRNGYTFIGWYEDSDFSGEAVTEISSTDYGDKTFYAKWEATDFVVQESTGSYTYTDNLLTITSGGDFTISMNTDEGITSTETDRILVSAGDDVTITLVSVQSSSSSASPFQVNTSSAVTIKLSGTNILTSSADGYAGLQNTASASLTITSASGDGSTEGTLTATGGSNGAGIGGANGKAGGIIIINGGTITATGNGNAAGIGGGKSGNGGTITINGGTVTANGGGSAAGIGGGQTKNGGTITVNGGTVTAQGGDCGAGIGGGNNGGGGTITINGGTINTTGGNSGAGIGNAYESSGTKVTISGGTITATGGEYAAGIGDSMKCSGSTDITITGGSVTANGGTGKSGGAAGIGSGVSSKSTLTVTINGGTVTATGGTNGAGIGRGNGSSSTATISIDGYAEVAATGNGNGAGIGGNSSTFSGTISITGGTVTATGGSNGAGIGGGSGSFSGSIVIGEGTVTATGGSKGAGIGGGSGAFTGTLEISGGYILAESASYDPIGGGSGGDDDSTITITGGYYGEGTLYSQVYDVEVANGYAVGYNAEEDSKDVYPYVIIEEGTELTVSFDAGDGESCEDITVTFGSAYGDELPTPSLYGYTFKGWYTEEDGEGVLIESETTVSIADDHTLYVLYELTPVDYVDASGATQICEEFTIVTADMTELTDELTDGWYAVISDVTISERITVSGEVHLILVDGHTLTASGGIAVNEGNILNIYGQSESTGKLAASSSTSGNAGIGGDSGYSAGTIIINGGEITAKGGYNSAGIGGGTGGNGGSITINNGTVTSTGNYNGAGIGGGYEGSSGEITINGGTVTATSTHTGAGIGGGYKGAGETITINGGTVTATSSDNGAGIGGGGNCTGGTITISGGTVTAVAQTLTSSQGSAGIGGGVLGDGGTITISGGTVSATGCGNGAGIGGGGGNGDGATGGSAGSINISGGYITASSSKGSIIGAGSNCSDGTITITGGYFGDGTLYTYAYDAEVATGYMVTSNEEEASKVAYPYVVTESATATVTFDTNGGTLSTETKTMEVTFHTAYGTLPTATKDWCVFDSWNTAADGSGDEVTSESIVSVYGDHNLYAIYTQVAVDYVDEDGETRTCEEYTLLTSDMTTLSAGWYVVGNDVTISDRIIISGEVHLILVDDYTLDADSGITVNSGNTLVIYGQEESTGTLNATSSIEYYPGIGGSVSASAGTITINGGVINAEGAKGAPGIGSGAGFNSAINTNATVITINNGTVTAVGGSDAAGIGGGQESNGGTITITGGTVSATGGNFGAGIGGGSGGDSDSGNGGTITITGGFIYAASGNTCGAGIGGGNKSPAGTVSISGGYIVTSSIGDGDGYTGTDDTVTITGGCFGEGVIAERTVYKVTVADAYGVRSNTEASTKATYPYRVVEKTPITGSVVISGSAVYGQTLTATASDTPDGTENSLEYQWQRDGVAISGATASTYILTADDVGSVITVVVSHPSCTTTLTASTSAVAKATLTASIAGTTTKTYDGTTAVSDGVSISLSGAVGEDEPTATAEIAYDSASVGDDKTITASGITLGSSWGSCYVLGSTMATCEGVITAKSVTASISGTTTKTYDGTTAVTDAQGLSITLEGVVDGDTVNASATSYAYDSANVGTDKTITASGIALSGTDAGNYELSAATATTEGTITAKDITVTITAGGGTYGGTITAATAELSGVVNTDNVSVTLTYSGTANDGTEYNSTTAPTLAGTYTVTATISDSNYSLTGTTEAKFVIAKAIYDMSGVSFADATYTYDGTEKTLIITGSESLPDGVTVTYTENTLTNVGSIEVTATFTGDADNYEAIDSKKATLTIVNADLTVTVNGYEGAYDGDAHGITVTVGEEDAAVTYSVAEEGEYSEDTYAYIDTGTYTVYYKVSKANYNGVSGSATVKITQRAVTVTIDSKSSTYGDEIEELTAEVKEGSVVEGDKEIYSLATEATSSSAVGSYDITGTAENDNYSITFVNEEGAYTISAAELANVTVSQAETLTYDGTAQTAEVAASAETVDGTDDEVTFTYSTSEDGDYSTEVPAFTDAGTYTVYYRATAANYETVEGSFTITIAAKEITATITAAGGTYGGTITAATAELNDVADADAGSVEVTLTYTGTANDGTVYSSTEVPTLAGTYTVTATISDSNYSLAGTTTAEFTIAKATYDMSGVSFADATVEYDGTEKALEISGTLADGVTVTYTSNTRTEAGSVTATAAFTGDSNNYETIASMTATLTVTVLVELPEQTFPDEDAEHKIELIEGISEVPETLKDNTELDTVEEIKTSLKTIVCAQTGYTEENIVYYEVTLMISFDGGKTWVKATEENFPEEGLTIVLPYPDGTNKDEYDFFVTHMFTTTAFGHTPGETENPAVTKTDTGLQVTLSGLSPIAVAWKLITQSSGETEAPTTPETAATEATTPETTATEAATEAATPETTATEAETETTATEAETETETTTEAETESETEAPVQTGDDTPLSMWLTLFLLSAAVLLMMGERKRQRG
ncbi:MAG: InlB B-repeat-containing protein [Lachnospiraceae bacterium]|nr:InlB B-repeat-containing protein [Lachnospiraceae bacterium]